MSILFFLYLIFGRLLDSLGLDVKIHDPSIMFWMYMVCLRWLPLLQLANIGKQIRYLENPHHRVPSWLEKDIDPNTFERSRQYQLDVLAYLSGRILLSEIIVSCFLLLDGLAWMWNLSKEVGSVGLPDVFSTYGPSDVVDDEDAVNGITFMLMVALSADILSSIFENMKIFGLETKYGFNQQSFLFFLMDEVKKITLGLLLVLIAGIGFFYIHENFEGRHLYLYLWLFISVFMITNKKLDNKILQPLVFDHQSSLKEGRLRRMIEELATRVGFPLQDIIVRKESLRSSHNNAYFSDALCHQVIVLDDTLFKSNPLNKKSNKNIGLQDEEIVAVVCHELGHWFFQHLKSVLIIYEIALLENCIFFQMFYKYPPLYKAFGFTEINPFIGIVILSGFLKILNTTFLYSEETHTEMTNLVQTVPAVHFMEYQADAYACSMGFKGPLRSALIKISQDNLQFPMMHPEFKLAISHPCLVDRIQMVDSDISPYDLRIAQ